MTLILLRTRQSYQNASPSTKTFTPRLNYSQSVFFQQKPQTVLSHEEQKICKGPVTQNECANALKHVDLDLTPGTDGPPAEFYKVYGKISLCF